MRYLQNVFAAILAVILTMLVVYFWPKNCDSVLETFEDGAGLVDVSSTCPADTNVFMTSDGMTQCCKGDVQGTLCHGKVICSISPSTTIPLCANLMANVFQKEGKSRCPPSMPNYYRTNSPDGALEFCTKSLVNSAFNGPTDANEPKCQLLKESASAFSKDSCYMMRLEELMKCPKTPCSYTRTQTSPKHAVLIQVSYTDSDGNPRSCYEDTSLENYYRSMEKKLSPNDVQRCSISKKVYVDKSMPISATVSS